MGQIARFLKALDRGIFIPPKLVDPAATMPPKEPERTAEAVRRILPELIKLDRYERRAFARHEQAVSRLLERLCRLDLSPAASLAPEHVRAAR